MHMHGFSNKRNNIFLWTQKHGGIFSNDNFELISSDRMFKSNWFNKNEINYLTSQKSPEIGLHSGKAWSRLGDKIAGARFLLSCIPAALCTWSHSHMPHTAVRWRCDFQWHVSRYIAKGKDSVPEASANISPSFIDFDGNTPILQSTTEARGSHGADYTGFNSLQLLDLRLRDGERSLLYWNH